MRNAGGGDDWFNPKRVGYGSGPPSSWKGWAAIVVLVGLIVADRLLLTGLAREGAMVVLIAAFAGLCAAKTRGGWRWRSGAE